VTLRARMSGWVHRTHPPASRIQFRNIWIAYTITSIVVIGAATLKRLAP